MTAVGGSGDYLTRRCLFGEYFAAAALHDGVRLVRLSLGQVVDLDQAVPSGARPGRDLLMPSIDVSGGLRRPGFCDCEVGVDLRREHSAGRPALAAPSRLALRCSTATLVTPPESPGRSPWVAPVASNAPTEAVLGAVRMAMGMVKAAESTSQYLGRR